MRPIKVRQRSLTASPLPDVVDVDVYYYVHVVGGVVDGAVLDDVVDESVGGSIGAVILGFLADDHVVLVGDGDWLDGVDYALVLHDVVVHHVAGVDVVRDGGVDDDGAVADGAVADDAVVDGALDAHVAVFVVGDDVAVTAVVVRAASVVTADYHTATHWHHFV